MLVTGSATMSVGSSRTAFTANLTRRLRLHSRRSILKEAQCPTCTCRPPRSIAFGGDHRDRGGVVCLSGPAPGLCSGPIAAPKQASCGTVGTYSICMAVRNVELCSGGRIPNKEGEVDGNIYNGREGKANAAWRTERWKNEVTGVR